MVKNTESIKKASFVKWSSPKPKTTLKQISSRGGAKFYYAVTKGRKLMVWYLEHENGESVFLNHIEQDMINKNDRSELRDGAPAITHAKRLTRRMNGKKDNEPLMVPVMPVFPEG